MNNSRFICNLEDLSDPGSRGFSLTLDDGVIEGFVVQQDGCLYAYQNRCPHTGAPLDWVEHQFLDLDLSFIQCSVHDARFAIDNGACITGPCIGDSLFPLPVVQQDQAVYLGEGVSPPAP